MKKGFFTTVFLAICVSILMAQIPQAFKYQAVVRDHNGAIIADQNINLRISILFGDPIGNEVYSETHLCTTNGMGLVNLKIGKGFTQTGHISEINWAEGEYYVKIEMDEHGGSDFKPMGVAQLLSVPYALHSGTAEGISGDGGDGVPANNWILFGNSNTDPTEDKLGTTDAADLVIVTDDIERMRVLSDGDVHIVNSANIGKNLTVEQNVNLNTFSGQTINHGPFTVANMSPTLLSGILTVDLHTDLNSSLNVDGVTDLNSAFNVNNSSPSLLTGTLLVNENATFNQHVTLDNGALGATSPSTGALVVAGGVGIGENLYVGGSAFFDGPMAITDETQSYDPYTGALTVAGGVGIAKRLNVAGASSIDSTLMVKGQLTVKATLASNDQSNYADYPLLVEGGNQGIAIKVNGNREVAKNYISFWDNDGGEKMWGRIEGITLSELRSDPEHIWETAFKISDVVVSGVDLLIAIADIVQAFIDLGGAISSSTACAGLGACVTAPIPSLIGAAAVGIISNIANGVLSVFNVGVATADLITFIHFKESNVGVSYQSGAGDYAEWLPKLNASENFVEGELVGLNNGYVTKSVWGADKVMIVSTNPIVLGNMPNENDENNNVKVAFMGQVPARVLGDVEAGDYILPSEFGSGFAKAVHPDDMMINDYKRVAGIAWSVLYDLGGGIKMVNVAVGLNNHDLIDALSKQEEQLISLRSEVAQMNDILVSLMPGYAEAAGHNGEVNGAELPEAANNDVNIKYTENNLVYSNEEDIVYFEVSRVQIEFAIDFAREEYQKMVDDAKSVRKILYDDETEALLNEQGITLMSVEDHPFWKRMDSDPAYKEEIVKYVKTTLEDAINTNKKYAHEFSDLEPHE
ncbi:MAG: hypothetical protein ABFS05_03915 [Bacteroidota bacterium]